MAYDNPGNNGQNPQRFKRNPVSSYRIRDDGHTEIFDLDFAAYCSRIRGEQLIELIPNNSRGETGIPRTTFVFKTPRRVISQLAIDYANSECSRLAEGIRSLKSAIRSSVYKGD